MLQSRSSGCMNVGEEGVHIKCANMTNALQIYHHYDCNAQILQPLSTSSTPHLWILTQFQCLIVLSCVLLRFFLGALKIRAQIFSGGSRRHLRASFERVTQSIFNAKEIQSTLLLTSPWICRPICAQYLVREMSQGQELQNLGSPHSYTGPYSGISGSRNRIKDEQTLARLGKKQVLKVYCDKSSPFARVPD